MFIFPIGELWQDPHRFSIKFLHWRIMTEFPLTQCKISPGEK